MRNFSTYIWSKYNACQQIRSLKKVMPKLSRETLEKRLNASLKKLEEFGKLNEKLWDDYHQAQKLIMRLEEENEYLRQKLGG